MTRSAARELFSNTRLQRWCFDVELIYLAGELRIPVVEVPVDWTEIPGEVPRLAAVRTHHQSLLFNQAIAPLHWRNMAH
jgi:dolichyl-phosphate beta-glucosyltransferase